LGAANSVLRSDGVVSFHLKSWRVVQDIGGDSFFFATIRSYRHKAWVDAMFVPYTLLFTLAAMVSLLSLGLHGYILLRRCRDHGAVVPSGPSGQGRPTSVAGVEVPLTRSAPLNRDRMSELKTKFDLHRFERWRHICGLLLGLLEDLPMGALLWLCEKSNNRKCARLTQVP
jgi:hypothetical protein